MKKRAKGQPHIGAMRGDPDDELIWYASFALDHNDDIYLSGVTYEPNFPTTAGAFDDTYNGKGGGG